MRRIPDGAEWEGVHSGETIFFKKVVDWHYNRGDRWSYLCRDGHFNPQVFSAKKIALEEIMEDFVNNE